MGSMSSEAVAVRVGEYIRRFRESCGFSQAGLALRVGCRQAAVSDWENGKANITVVRRVAIADALAVPVRCLLP
jgi:transcriptional regulator with XRE-family HTH domain